MRYIPSGLEVFREEVGEIRKSDDVTIIANVMFCINSPISKCELSIDK